jgi:hypothetical protein
LFTFWVFFQDKSFKLISKYTQKCQYKLLYQKEKTSLQHLKLGKLNFGIRKIGCSMSWTRYRINFWRKMSFKNHFLNVLPGLSLTFRQ